MIGHLGAIIEYRPVPELADPDITSESLPVHLMYGPLSAICIVINADTNHENINSNNNYTSHKDSNKNTVNDYDNGNTISSSDSSITDKKDDGNLIRKISPSEGVLVRTFKVNIDIIIW
jgi:hypothetical protein